MPSRPQRGPDVDHGQRERRRLDGRDALTCWVVWWACQDLNLGPHPYQQSTGNRCANGCFRRSRATVGAEVKCSNSLQLSALPTRPEPCRHCADHYRSPKQYAKPLHRYLPAHTPLPCYLSIPLPPPSALPHQPDSAPTHLSVVPLPSPRTIQIQHMTARRCTKPTTEDLGTNSPGRRFAVAATPHPSAPLPRRTRR
jgi:hypothetical protein